MTLAGMADNDPRTGGMIALIPAAEDAERLAVQGGDDPDDLHLTLVYLGDDVTGWDDTVVDQLTADLDEATTALGGPLTARVMGHALFNPDGGPDGDMDPCAVYLVGDTSEVGPLRDSVLELLARHQLPVPEQHTPYIPHVTGGYGIDTSVLAEAGPVTFDRLRIALGDQEIDVPFGEPLTELDDDYEPPEPIPVDEVEVKKSPADAKDSGDTGTYSTYNTPTGGGGVEVKVASPDPRAARLRAYWAHGAGLKKWFLGLKVRGNFRRLQRHLRKYIHDMRILKGATANIYHEATGQWPGRRGRKALPAEVEFKSLWDYDDPDSDVVDDGEQAMCEGIDGWGQEFLDRVDDVADPDGEQDEVPAEAGVEEKAAPPVGLVTIPAADLPPDLFPDDYLDDNPDDVDRLMLDVDAAILAADRLVTTDDEDPDDEPWTAVASRDHRYVLGADAVLEPVDNEDDRRNAPPAAVL